MGDFSAQNEGVIARLKQRPDYEGLLYWGMDNSLQLLPNLGLTWCELARLGGRSGKPIADLGSCFSTFAVEGELRGVPVIPVDIMYPVLGKQYADQVGRQMQNLADRYCGRAAFPPGFEIPGGPIPSHEWQERLQAALTEVERRRRSDAIEAIGLPDRSCSVVLAHESVPKHSQGFKFFLERQLPEMLRVADEAVFIYPLAVFRVSYFEKLSLGCRTAWSRLDGKPPLEHLRSGAAREDLEEHCAIHAAPELLTRLADVAERQGFSFIQAVGAGDERLPDRPARLGVFHRQAGGWTAALPPIPLC